VRLYLLVFIFILAFFSICMLCLSRSELVLYAGWKRTPNYLFWHWLLTLEEVACILWCFSRRTVTELNHHSCRENILMTKLAHCIPK